jgi:hypothetical protein
VAIRDELFEEVVDGGEGFGRPGKRRRLHGQLRAKNGNQDRAEHQAGSEGACHARSMR